jgi:hypothetical protein
VIFLDIGEILEKGVHESSVCDTGVYRFPNFHIFKQFPFQIPYNLDHFFPILNYRHGMCFRASSVFVLSILFRFPQRTHYF